MALRAVANECERVILEVILLKKISPSVNSGDSIVRPYQELFPGPILTFCHKVSFDQPNSSPHASFPP